MKVMPILVVDLTMGTTDLSQFDCIKEIFNKIEAVVIFTKLMNAM
jgi:hypothetical protein